MKCVIPGGNVKILARAIHTLAKIGDEMYVSPLQESISFRAINMAKSAYCDFTFQKNFFSYYTLGDLEEEEAQKCKISMRSAMTVFKSAHTLDKQVETCHIHLEMDACDLIFILKYKNGVNKSHLSPVLDSEKLQASYTKAGMTNELTSRARTLMDALQNFPQNMIEITLELTPQKLLLRNYVDDASVLANITRTQLALGIGEFDRYAVSNETTITFCLKEFKSLLTFSENVGVPVSINFETAGRPMLLALKSHVFEVNLLLSTLNPDTDSQSDSTSISRPLQPVRKRSTSSKNVSRRGNKTAPSRKKSTVTIKSTINNIFKDVSVHENNSAENQLDRTARTSTSIVFREAEANDSTNNIRERNQKQQEQNRSFALSSASTTSRTNNRRMSRNQQKLVSTVFSSITKRKSTSDNESFKEEEKTDCIDLEDNIPHSPPPRLAAKRARLVFQRCFQNTFDPRMLPGHDVIVAEDSDENNSD